MQPYPSTVALIGELKRAGVRVAIISASKNTTMILEAAGVRGLFEAQVDGEVAADLGLPGKPDPAVFVEAARRVGAAPARAAVVEDAIAGVEAGRARRLRPRHRRRPRRQPRGARRRRRRRGGRRPRRGAAAAD